MTTKKNDTFGMLKAGTDFCALTAEKWQEWLSDTTHLISSLDKQELSLKQKEDLLLKIGQSLHQLNSNTQNLTYDYCFKMMDFLPHPETEWIKDVSEILSGRSPMDLYSPYVEEEVTTSQKSGSESSE